MKIMTILGTRPEIIRLSQIIRKLDLFASKHILVHTGQNNDRMLNDIFFEQMRIRTPDYRLNISSYAFGRQIGQIFGEAEKIIEMEQPDRLLVLGDTNSSLCAVLGERKGIPVFHMEAGNRCFDPAVPEEINRKIIDSIASYHLPYTTISRDNLLRENVPPQRIWVSGNPIFEVMQYYLPDIGQSGILQKLGLVKERYIVATAHRAENVDNETRLRDIVEGLDLAAQRLAVPIICSIHPRTQSRLQQFGIKVRNPLVQFHPPFGFFDFIHLQKHAGCVITDSGTVQEESCILGVPAVTIRNSTERPETVMCGSNTISGLEPRRIAECVNLMMQAERTWTCPEGYNDPDVSSKVVKMLLGGVGLV